MNKLISMYRFVEKCDGGGILESAWYDLSSVKLFVKENEEMHVIK